MGTTATHILKKLEKVKARTAQHRADRKIDIQLGHKSLFKKATFQKAFTKEDIENFKLKYQTTLEQRRKRNRWMIWIVMIIGLPAIIWFLHTVFMYGINS